jgi:hypothetical protein
MLHNSARDSADEKIAVDAATLLGGKRFGQKMLFEDVDWLVTADESLGLPSSLWLLIPQAKLGWGTGRSTAAPVTKSERENLGLDRAVWIIPSA